MGTGAIKTGTILQLTGQREDGLWNVAKRAMPAGASDASVLSYMKYLAQENGIELDARNNVKSTPRNAAILKRPIKIPEYKAPTMEQLRNGAELAPYMRGESVKELKQMLNRAVPGAGLDVNDDTYDENTKAALDRFRKSEGLQPRRDGTVNAATLARLNNPNNRTTDSVTTDTNAAANTDRTAPQQNVVSLKGNREPKINELETNANFSKLAEDQKMDVRRAMRGKPPEAQDRLASLAKEEKFKSLSAAHRKKILAAAESDDPDVQRVLKDMVSGNKFHYADTRVKDGVIDLLSKDSRYALNVEGILNAEGGTQEQLKMIEKAKTDGPMLETAPRNLKDLQQTRGWKKLTPDQQRAVSDSMIDVDEASQSRMASLSLMPGYAQLDAVERLKFFDLAVNSSFEMEELLVTIGDTDKFIKSSPQIREQVLDLAKKDPNDAKEINEILNSDKDEKWKLSRLALLQ